MRTAVRVRHAPSANRRLRISSHIRRVRLRSRRHYLLPRNQLVQLISCSHGYAHIPTYSYVSPASLSANAAAEAWSILTLDSHNAHEAAVHAAHAAGKMSTAAGTPQSATRAAMVHAERAPFGEFGTLAPAVRKQTTPEATHAAVCARAQRRADRIPAAACLTPVAGGRSFMHAARMMASRWPRLCHSEPADSITTRMKT